MNESVNTTEDNQGRRVIPFYRKSVYGRDVEYVADNGAAGILRQLTGQKTITGVQRELIRDLTGGKVTFTEVLAPASNGGAL